MQSTLNLQDLTDSSSIYLHERSISRLCERLMYTILKREHTTLILDLTHFESLNNSELMTLLPALSLAQKLQQQIIFCGLTAKTRLVFELTQLDRAFPVVSKSL